MKTLDNVTVKVTVEVTKKAQMSYGEHDTIAKSVVEDTSSCVFEELEAAIDIAVNDARLRAQKQLANTKRIKEIERQQALLACAGPSVKPPEVIFP